MPKSPNCYPSRLVGASLAILFLVAPFAAAPCTAEELAALEGVTHKLESGTPVTFATFGDSITWPCFHTDFRQNYITLAVDALRKSYLRAEVRIVHAGNMGTAGRGLEAGRFEKHVLAFRPDVVFLMFGMNDCATGPVGLDDFDRNLTALIAKSRTAEAVPVVCTQNEILYDSVDGGRRQALASYMQRAVEVACRHGVPAVDCFAAWQTLAADRDELIARLNDWIHPNLAGHRLLAKCLIDALWPVAAEHVPTDLRGPEPTEPETPCLLPGPANKQIAHAGDTWFTVTGRRHGSRITDLDFSWSEKPDATWSDFSHVTLIGAGRDAVFDDEDRTITGAVLFEDAGRLYVVFSWNVGVYFVALDVSQPGWADRLANPDTWLEHTDEPFRRPTILLTRQQDGGRLLDASPSPSGWPTIVCAHFQLAASAGWEVVEGMECLALVTGAKGEAPHIDLLPEVERPLPLPKDLAEPYRFYGDANSGAATLYESQGQIGFSFARK